jgi:hypothetical protein
MTINHIDALDLASAGNWDSAHQLVHSASDPLSCLIHAYIHRVEGDLWNARYWYNRANQELPDNSQEEELERLYQLARNE